MSIAQPKLDPGICQCPGEPYTVPEFICRGRQEKHYEKCSSCLTCQERKVVPLPFIPSYRYEQRMKAEFQDPGRSVRYR
ncbi:MAG: hypothetical protein AAB215_08305 [Planctomycetota bacterium]